MLSRLIAIMIGVSFVIIPAYAEETKAATETEVPAVAKQDKPAKVNLLDKLEQAYEKNDRETMGRIIEKMQQRRKQMRQRRAEFRKARQNRRENARRGGQGQAGFGPGRCHGCKQMRPQQWNQGRGGWHRGPGHWQGGMHGRGGRGYQRGFG